MAPCGGRPRGLGADMNQMNRLNVLSGAAMTGTDPASGILGAFPFMDLDAAPEGAAGKAARKKIWDLPGMYHCSVVGTCLSTAELRKLLGRLGMGEAGESDHELHGRGVGLVVAVWVWNDDNSPMKGGLGGCAGVDF